jgi:hypothetical protein
MDETSQMTNDELIAAFTLEDEYEDTAQDETLDTPSSLQKESSEDLSSNLEETLSFDDTSNVDNNTVDEELSSPTNEEVSSDWESRYKELQSHKDRQIAEKEAELEAYRNLISQASQATPAHSVGVQATPNVGTPAQEPSEDELRAGVKTAPIDTFTWAIENASHLVPGVIALLREEHGHGVADRAMFVYQREELNRLKQSMKAEQAQRDAPNIVRSNMLSAIDHVRQQYPDDFDSYREAISNRLKSENRIQNFYDPQHIANEVQIIYLEEARKAAVTRQQPREVPPQTFTETGRPGGNTEPEPSQEDLEAEMIVKAFNSGRYRG